MENEVDRLEIVVESESSKAIRSMTSLEKKVNNVADALERCMLIAQGAVSLKGVNMDKLFSGAAMEKSAKMTGKKLADDLIKNFNLNLSGKDVENQVRSLTRKISKGFAENGGKAYKGASNDVEELGKIIAKNGMIAKSTSDDYQNLYNWMRKAGKIRVSPEVAKSLGDDYKQCTPVMKQKLSTKSGIELDSMYQELREQFPSILKDAYSVEDEFYNLDNALREFYKTSNSFYKPEWMEKDAYESVIDGVEDISNAIKNAKKEVGDFTESLRGIEDTGKSFSELLGAGMDTSGLERACGLAREVVRGQRSEGQKKTRSDLKYPVQPFAEINRKFKDSTLETDFSKMSRNELETEIAKNERAYLRVKQAINNMITLEGTDELGGKDWYTKIMQMNQYENAIDSATEAYGRLNAISGTETKSPSLRSFSAIDGYVEKARKSIGEIIPPTFDSEEELISHIRNLEQEYEDLYAVARRAVSEIDFGEAIRGLAEIESELDSARTELSHFGKELKQDIPTGKKIDVGNIKELFDTTFGDGAADLARNLAEAGAGASEVARKLNELNTEFSNRKVVTYEAQIKNLKNTLSELASQGFSEGDPEYDYVVKKIAVAEEALKRYKKSMREAAKVELDSEKIDDTAEALKKASNQAGRFKRIMNGISSAGSKINSVAKSFKDVSKTIKNAKDMANKVLHPIKTLKDLLGSEGGKRGMPFGRMIGSSIMFSTVFGVISQIKQAIKEGSDNLVQYSSEYNKSISGMVSSLLYLKNAWAVAFAPIVNVVGPYISAFIDMVSSALNAVGHFMAALTGKGYVVQAKKAWKNYGASIGDSSKNLDSANASAKKLQRTILGFDELHVLNDNDSNSGSGSGNGGSGGYTGPSPVDMFETIEVSSSMKDLAGKFKEAIKNSDFTEIGEMLGNKLKSAMESIDWNSIYQKANNFGKDLATFLNGLISPELFYDLGTTLAGAINTALHTVNSFAINFDWSEFGRSLASSIKGFLENWDAGLTAETFSNFGKGLLEGITGFISGLSNDKTFETIGQKLVDFICGIDWFGLTWNLSDFFKSLTNALMDFPSDFAKGVAQGIVDKIFGEKKVKIPEIKWLDSLQEKIAKMSLRKIPLFDVIFNLSDFKEKTEAIVTFVSDMKTKVEEVLAPLANFFSSIFNLARENTQSPFAGIGDWFSDRKTDIQNGLSGIGEWIGSKFSSGRKSTNNSFSDIGTWFSKKKSDIQTNLKDVGSWIGSKFQTGRTNVNKAFSDVGAWFTNRKTEIQNGTKDIDTWMNMKYTTARKNVNAAFSDVGTWFGSRKNDIQTNMDSINTWFNTKYQSARGYVNSAFSSVGGWFGSRKGDIQANMDSINTWFYTKYQSARGYVNSAFSNIGSWFGSRRAEIQNNMSSISGWFRDTFRNAYNAITGIFNNIGSYFSRIGENIKSPIRNALNGVINGVNWVLGRLGSGTRYQHVNFATGTGPDGVTCDTLGMVNDQSGNTYRELVQFPNGKTIIPKGRNVMLPMPKGTKVLPAGKTKALMHMNGIQHFKNGAGSFNVFEYLGHPTKLMQYAVNQFVSFKGAIEPGLSMAKGAVNTVFGSAVNSIKGVLQSFEQSLQNVAGSGVERWRNLAKTALIITRQYTPSNLTALLKQMQHESGGNPRAINLWDSNAKAGIPSKGLMQVIDPTFRAYALSPYNKNIYDPLSNMIAAIRYTVSRYGSLHAGWTARGYKGYENGGMPKRGEIYLANENGFGSEYIGRMGNNHVVANNQQIVDGIKAGVIDAMMEVYIATQGSSANDNSKIPYIINAVLKTEDNEVLARAVEKGQASRDSRFNPSPAY